ncbi:huntingtin-interacting protein K [Neocloeon triangulifer]|uniref:huntingtin-interacting protein K n=1 Tax=Neocloeon triangulifer TaxID=2078957 RepID=UPI00286F1FED|nr:huntingtin-interacting protein K [Neocloeon triangulifer]
MEGSPDEEVYGEEVEQEKSQKKSAKHDSGAADLEKVTDYAEEQEIMASDLAGAMTIIDNMRRKEDAERIAKEKELAKVSIKKEDVDLMVHEMEISRILAERTLREHHGNVVDALISLTN